MARGRVPERCPGDEIRWRDQQGRIVRCQPPVHVSARPLTWDEVSAWAHRWQVPEDAARDWWDRPDRGPSRVTYLGDVDIVEFTPQYKGEPSRCAVGDVVDQPRGGV
jgi:hypothetical protein